MPSKKDNILLVDDDARMLRMMQMILETEGYQVVLASNGEDALNTLVKGNIDLILLDIMMPGMDGIQLATRCLESDPDLAVIILADHSIVHPAIRALRLGVEDYLRKSAGSEALRRAIRQALENLHEHPGTRRRGGWSSARSWSPPS